MTVFGIAFPALRLGSGQPLTLIARRTKVNESEVERLGRAERVGSWGRGGAAHHHLALLQPQWEDPRDQRHGRHHTTVR